MISDKARALSGVLRTIETAVSRLVTLVINILGVSRSNAFVYHTKASKILFSANNVDEIMAKVSPQYKKVTETVQGTSTTKKAQKLAEIDAFLANAPTAKGNPFASLGA